MRRSERLFLCAAAMAGMVLLLNLRVGAGGLDSPEVVAASRGLGQLHPPGHPAYLGFSMLFFLLPLGDAAFRLATLSAVALSMSAGLVAVLLDREIVDETFAKGRENLRVITLGAWAAMSVCVPGVFEQGVRPEVYALEVFLCLLGLVVLLRCRKKEATVGDFWALGLIEGLALAHHHYLTALSLAPVTFWLLWRQKNRLSTTLQVSVGVGVGLMAYLVYWVRDPAATQLFWFDTQTWQGFVDMVTARTFHGSVTSDARADLIGNVPLALGMLPRFVGIVPFLLGLAGIGLCFWRRLDSSAVIGLVICGALFSKVLMYADPENPDDRGYLALAMVLWTAMGAAILAPCSHFLDKRLFGGRAIGAWICALCIVFLGTERVSSAMASNSAVSTTPFLRSALAPVPANSLALIHYFQTHFLIQYGQTVEGRRPDVLETQASFGARVRGGEDTLRILARRSPEMGAIIAGVRQHGVLPATLLLDSARKRPVVLDPAPEQRSLPLDNMEFRGILARLYWEPLAPTCTADELNRGFADLVDQGGDMADLVAFSLLEQSVFHLRRGNAPCAEAALSLLSTVTGKSALIEKLQAKTRGLYLRADSGGIVSPSPYRDMSFP